MSRKRSHDAIECYRERFLAGAIQRSVSPEIAEAVFQKLLGFASFGFPKSHAAAFALLAYQSAWLRHHYPAEFLCALLNAQPMGFYPPSSLVRDGERRGVEVRTPDINLSNVHCVLEKTSVRVGLGFIRGVGEESAAQLVAEREAAGRFTSVHDLTQRAPLSRAEFDALAVSGACDLFGWPRRQLLWRLGLAPRSVSAGEGGEARQLVLPIEPTTEIPELPDETVWERVLSDYRSIGLSTGQHPIELLRAHLPKEVLASCDLPYARHGEQVAVAGMVVARQRPSTANGIIFMLLEDEHGHINLVIPPPTYDKYRTYVRGEPLLLARGRFEHIERNRNIVVNELASLAELARQASGEAELLVSLPSAHSFGRR
jgi:error-prone DNA polymerase